MKRFFLYALATLCTVACGRNAAEEPANKSGPQNEVRVTAKQVSEAGITTESVEARAIADPIIATGHVTFSDSRVAHVFSPLTGRIDGLPVSLGEFVERGAPLAVIESPDLASAVADLRKAEADLAAAERELERQKELYEAHAAAQRDFEAAESNDRKAKAERERAAQKCKLLDARTGGESYVLRSPISGTVAARNATIGMEVQGQYSGGNAPELFTIGNLDPVWVLADIFEIDLPRVRMGAPVKLSVAAYGDQPFNGTVDWISGGLDPVTRTAKVRCVIRNPQHLLRPEMFVTASIDTGGRPALAAPRSAIIRTGDQMVAYVDRGRTPDGGERFERRTVTIDDAKGGAYVPVLSGLDAGDRVVTSGALLLSGEST
jgi:cobalt-zinc-cadmium efflux system membrane fusion protein